MSNIFVSIIVPVYNVEQYLRECLDSIAQLKAFSWEVILIDDGSTDSSGAICDEYAKREPKFRVIHQKNAGVSAARNAGLDAAKGEWIWFVDSDDSINPDFEILNPEVLNDADYVLFDMRKFRDGEELNSLGHQKSTVTCMLLQFLQQFQMKFLHLNLLFLYIHFLSGLSSFDFL